MAKPKVVYTDPPWALNHQGLVDPSLATIERQVFGDAFDLCFGPAIDGRYVDGTPALHAAVAGAHALIIYRCRMTPDVLASAGSGLRVVCRQGVGFDNLAPDLLRARGIMGFNIPDYCIDEVAAHTMALLLSLERGVVPQHNRLSAGEFNIYAGGIPRRLRSCTAGILGLGRIGRALAARLRMFYGRVIAYDPYVASDLMDAHGVDKVDFDTLLSQADVVTLHCPLSGETRRILNADAFACMKPTTLVINAARGDLVDPQALWDALDGGRIAGAGIDVFSPEDPHRDEWYARVVRHPNVVVTSHRAFLSRESEVSQRRRAAEGVRRALETGCPPAVGLLT